MDITLEFINSTAAKGCFVVLQDRLQSLDVFRAVPLPELSSSTTLTTTIDNILPSVYKVFVYDLEWDGVPSRSPAHEPSDNIAVFGEAKGRCFAYILSVRLSLMSKFFVSVQNATSQFIQDVIIYQCGLEVLLVCEFKDDIEGASCVMVYREYGNKTLLVKEYPQTTVFPVPLTINHNKIYTFGVFGKNGFDIDERPMVTKQFQLRRTVSPPLPTSATTGS